MTTIEWTHPSGYRGESWNPVTGCTKVSAGCKHCYAERDFPRVYGVTGRRFIDVAMHHDRLDRPLRARAPRCYFVNSMSDLFHAAVPDEFIAAVFGVMAVTPQHRFIVLTKRPARLLDWFAQIQGANVGAWTECHAAALALDGDDERLHHHDGGDPARPWPLPNVWLGVSAEDQATADERIPLLLQTPAAVRLVSLEPLLGPVELTSVREHLRGESYHTFDALAHPDTLNHGPCRQGLDWLIVGGESGPGARPCNVQWIRDIVQQGRAAGAATFVKQLGAHVIDRNDAGYCGDGAQEWPEGTRTGDSEKWQGAPTRVLLRDRKGGDPSEWPADLRVREWPREAAAVIRAMRAPDLYLQEAETGVRAADLLARVKP